MIGELRTRGFFVVEKALSGEIVAEAREASYRAQEAFRSEIGMDRIARAGEHGGSRAPMKFDPFFYSFLRLPALISLVDDFLGPHAILHVQNSLILAPKAGAGSFQSSFHRDFPRTLAGFMVSLNVYFALSDFTAQNGALRVVPGSHQREKGFSPENMECYGGPVLCGAGAMIVFDSTLWHCAGFNTTHSDRLAVNHQFTAHYLKPQLDYVRLLGEETILGLPPRTQRLLGWNARVPSSLEEYYRAPEERVYRGGQG